MDWFSGSRELDVAPTGGHRGTGEGDGFEAPDDSSVSKGVQNDHDTIQAGSVLEMIAGQERFDILLQSSGFDSFDDLFFVHKILLDK